MEVSKPHAILLSSPGMGHLIPMLELGKRLVTLHSFEVTIFVVSSGTSPAESQTIQSSMSPKLCQVIELPPVDISSLVESKAKVVANLTVMMREIKPALRSAISTLKVPPTALIVDLFGTEALVIAHEFKIPKYVFIPTHAWFIAFSIYVPILDKVVKGEYVDQKEDFVIPGCRPARPEDVVEPMLDRTNQQYYEYLRMCKEFTMGDGILLNTWEELESSTLAALRDDKLFGDINRPPIYPVGPILRPNGSAGSRSHELFDWLDRQPSESVVYVSFGSGGTLSNEQMTELAWGLELSQRRFIWAVRQSTVRTGDGSFFITGKGGDDLSSNLPEGFLIRTQGLGVVVRDWAPQVDILSHPSVGGFLSHCGWNSALESVTNGVPMIAWPLYAEQRLNAALLTEELGVAVRSKILPSKGIVGREEINMTVRRIMADEEGHGIRARVKELKHKAEEALSEGGSSYHSLSQFTQNILMSMQKSPSP
ncbi:UDPGT domain-containing protein [Cephalotus follicularis]|uniref:Glycosyltransferase n=1 Tax=Cephalotus follicularis TaxID=3775 RepID=A0A1Q3BMN4_CEPFO|nr:UDPGT domain-containing protein [Cephalotus follicularis]